MPAHSEGIRATVEGLPTDPKALVRRYRSAAGTALRALMPPPGSALPTPRFSTGWEHRTRYVETTVSRGRAKAIVAYEEGEAFTDMSCVRVWLVTREITEQEAADHWIEEWYPGYVASIGCKRTDEGAVAWWEVTWPA